TTFDFWFKKPEDSAAINCSAHLAVPAGATPAGGLDVTTTAECRVVKPSNSLGAVIGSVQGQPSFNPTVMKLYGVTFVDWFGESYGPAGIIWVGNVTTPGEFGFGGGWNYTQLLT
ncbi:MAG: hypothetical protein V4671_12635, partial [Armatimonadota bacterium]